MGIRILAGHRHRLAAAAAALLLLLSASPGSGAKPLAADRPAQQPVHRVLDLGELNGQDLATIVRAAYQTLQRYTGGELKLEVTAIETVYPEQFGRLPWLDLVDMADGRLVDVSRQARFDATLTKREVDGNSVLYRPAWRSQEKLWSRSAWGKTLGGMTVEAVLRETGREKPELLAVRAISRYVVRAELGGQVRTYRAAFLWTTSEAGGRTSFVVADNVVQGVEQAVREAERPRARPSFRIKPDAAPDRSREPWEKDDEIGLCQEETTSYSETHGGSGDGGHLWGSHSSSATFHQACSCLQDCSQTCFATVNSPTCSDSGFTDICHQMSASTAASSATAYGNGDSSPTACGAGAGCIEKGCLFCLCGLSVTVSVSGVTVSFTKSPSDWDGSYSFSRACPACRRTSPPPSPPPSGGPPGGGGGGGSNGGGGGQVPILTDSCDADQDGWVSVNECYFDCKGWTDGEFCYVKRE